MLDDKKITKQNIEGGGILCKLIHPGKSRRDNKKILYPLTFNLEEPEPFIAAGFRSMIKHNDNTKG